jgi:hypothetical protein
MLQGQRKQLRIFYSGLDGQCEAPSCQDVAGKSMKSMLSPQRVQMLLQIGLEWKKIKGRGGESAISTLKE